MAKEAGISLKDRKVLVLGSGGASRMVQVAARDEGAASVSVASRKGPITYNALPQDAEIIVNTTPVGTCPHVDDQPVDLHLFPHCKGVLDLIYNPLQNQTDPPSRRAGNPFFRRLSHVGGSSDRSSEYLPGSLSFGSEMKKSSGISRRRWSIWSSSACPAAAKPPWAKLSPGLGYALLGHGPGNCQKIPHARAEAH